MFLCKISEFNPFLLRAEYGLVVMVRYFLVVVKKIAPLYHISKNKIVKNKTATFPKVNPRMGGGTA